MDRTSLVRVSILVAALVAMMSGATVEAAEGPPFCRVRNVTQRSVGASLRELLPATQAGDQLVVEGTCLAGVIINHDLVIRGATDRATLTGENRPTLQIVKGATVKLRRLTITGGRGVWLEAGGGVLNEGTLSIVDSRIVGNRASADGGGIYNEGRLTLVDSLVSENLGRLGGGIHSWGEMTLRHTTVARNSDASAGGGGLGGGIYIEGGTVTLHDSVIRGNRASFAGGGIALGDGSLFLYGTTVTRNWRTGIFNFDGTVTIDASSSVTGNKPRDCRGTPAC